MEKTVLKILWALLFLICAGMGLVPEPEGAVSGLMIFLGILFFVPPGWLLVMGWRDRDTKLLKLLRSLSLLSLAVTFALMVANFLSVLAPQWVGDGLYWGLAILGTPMACLQNPYVSLFAWAILLFAGIEGLKEAKK